jgi:hypothetical protein
VTDPYAVDFTGGAAAQIRPPFPTAVYKMLVDVLIGIARDPYATTEHDVNEASAAYRWAPFGEHGWVHLYIDDDRRTIRIFDVTWLG